MLAIEEVSNKLFYLDDSQEEMVVVPKRSMKSLNMRETRDLEKWVLKQSGATFNRNIFWIGKQDHVSDEQRSDLTGIDTEGNLIICELKRGTATEVNQTQVIVLAAECSRSNSRILFLGWFCSIRTQLKILKMEVYR